MLRTEHNANFSKGLGSKHFATVTGKRLGHNYIITACLVSYDFCEVATFGRNQQNEFKLNENVLYFHIFLGISNRNTAIFCTFHRLVHGRPKGSWHPRQRNRARQSVTRTVKENVRKRERERERGRIIANVYIFLVIHFKIDIFVCKYKKRTKERDREHLCLNLHLQLHRLAHPN